LFFMRVTRDPGIGPLGEQPVVVVAPIIDDDGAGRKVHLIRRLDVGHLAVSDEAETGQIAVMVEHQVQFHRPLGATELRPVIEGQAQIDHGRVQTHQLVLEAELLLAHPFGRHDPVQAVEHLLEQPPGAVAVGVGERGAGRGFDAQVGKLAFTALEAPFDLPQGVRAAQLAEQHGDELTPARQPLGAVLCPGFLDDALEVGARNELEYLTEHAA
jgi:hypothetical protein